MFGVSGATPDTATATVALPLSKRIGTNESSETVSRDSEFLCPHSPVLLDAPGRFHKNTYFV